jgi:hypothetical protein
MPSDRKPTPPHVVPVTLCDSSTTDGTDSPAQNTSALRFKAEWISPAHLAVAAAVLYVLGFVIVNIMMARYELVRFDLLRGRYIAAALLMIFCTIIPGFFSCSVGFLRSRQSRTPDGKRGGKLVDRASGWAIMFVILVTTGIFIDFLLLFGVLVGRSWLPRLIAFVAATCFSGLWIGYSVHGLSYLRKREARRRELVSLLVSAPMTVLGISIVFGTFLYPDLSRAVGGGATKIALISTSDSTLPPDVAKALRRRVAILDRDGDMMNLLVCIDSSASIARPVSIRSIAIRSVVLEGNMAAPDAAPVLCDRVAPTSPFHISGEP